jgi:2,3-bisphosphoglycerate-dependent phosphoglycerate mutase
MTPTTVYLVRHAASVTDPTLPEPFWGLSETGREQARALVPHLMAAGITRLYASPYPRAIDTVRPFADAARLDIVLEYDVRERSLTRSTHDDWQTLLERSWLDFDFAMPDGESNRAAQTRMRAAIEAIAARHPGETVAVATHGTAIGLLLHALDGRYDYARWKTLRNPDLLRLEVTPSGLRWDEAHALPPELAALRTSMFA